jgi:hypothetical protein
MAVTADKTRAEASGFNNFIRTTLAVGEFYNCARRSIVVDLNFSHDKITDGAGNGRAGLVGATMDGRTLIN